MCCFSKEEYNLEIGSHFFVSFPAYLLKKQLSIRQQNKPNINLKQS
jgi:hypothetical protein